MLRQPVHPAYTRESIRAASADRVDDRSSGTAELRADPASFDVDFRNVEFVDLRAQIAERRAGDVGAVDQIQVVLPAPARRWPDRATIVRDAGNQLKQASIGTLERKAVESLVCEVESDLGRPNVDNRAGGVHRHRFLKRETQDEVHLSIPSHFNDGNARRPANAGLFCLDDVFAGYQVLKLVEPIGTGLRGSAHRQRLT